MEDKHAVFIPADIPVNQTGGGRFFLSQIAPAVSAPAKLLFPVPSPPVMPSRLPCVPSGTPLMETSISDMSGGLPKSISHGLRIAIVSEYKLSKNLMNNKMKFSRVFPILK